MSDLERKPTVSAENVTRAFGSGTGQVEALRGVSLTLSPGELTAIMGASGSGKSTLMHIMAGLDRPSSGTVHLGGREITSLNDQELTILRRRRVGFVFQSFNLVPTLTVEGNVRLPFDLDGRRPTTGEQAWIDALLERLGLADRLEHRPHELSGGQQQRVAVARALATRPAIVFADEPTGSLDSATGRELLALLAASANDSGQTIAMVTHDPVAASFASRVVFLADGRIVGETGRLSAAEISTRVRTKGGVA